jgi:hypothetical protein
MLTDGFYSNKYAYRNARELIPTTGIGIVVFKLRKTTLIPSMWCLILMIDTG